MVTVFSPRKVIDNTDLLPDIDLRFLGELVDLGGGGDPHSAQRFPNYSQQKHKGYFGQKICTGDQNTSGTGDKNIPMRPTARAGITKWSVWGGCAQVRYLLNVS